MLRGTRRPIGDRAIPEKKISVTARLHNRFDVEVLDVKTGELKQKAVGYNVICNALWDKIFSSYNSSPATYAYFKYILIGTGSGTPAATDTTLFTRLGAKNNWNGYTRVFRPEQSMGYSQAVITLQAEEYVGSTITEVGIGYDATHVVTHAMLEDMNGNPISITKTATDVIKIYATIYLHWTAGGAYGGALNLYDARLRYGLLARLTGTSDYDSSRYASWVFYLSRATWSNVYRNTTEDPFALTTTVSSAQRKVTVRGRLAADQFNRGAIRFFVIDGLYGYWGSGSTPREPNFYLAMGSWFTPPQITAEAVGTGDGTKRDFSTYFPVKTAGTVYVDGVAASGVTVRPGAMYANVLHRYLMRVTGVADGNPYLSQGYDMTDIVYGYRLKLQDLARGSAYKFHNDFASAGTGKVIFTVNQYYAGAATFEVDMSQDCITWTKAGEAAFDGGEADNATKTVEIPAELQHMPYIQIKLVSSADSTALHYSCSISAPGENLNTNIHFDTPPAAGAVITADYTPDCIAKDSNHVFDLTLELTLGEYQEV